MPPGLFARAFLHLDLYQWQEDAVNAASYERSRVALVAANGSGKTAAVNTVLLLWWLYAYPAGRAVVTSGSWEQIKTQLWPSLRLHENTFRAWGWTFNSEEIRTPEHGFIRPFSVDSPARAEGHHEKPDANSPMLIMVDEAKGISEGIFDALNRCTPTCLILTSSTGIPSGTFYDAFHRNSRDFFKVKVTAFDCPHISKERIELAQRIYGPNYEEHPIYRSMILAEWTEGDLGNIIPRRLVEQALQFPPERRHGDTYAGIDWAAGGDETVMAVREGNALRIVYSNREPDTTRSAALMAAKCRELGIEDCRAMADVCGIGLVIKQHAQKVHDFIFRDFNGGEPADDKEHYVNRNIEAWSFFRRSLEMGQVCFPDGLDADAVNQLCNRMLQWNAAGKMMCERKEDMKKRGVHSPDRADALVMAWWAGRHMRYEGEEVLPMVPNVDYIERGDIMPANFDL